MLSVDVYFFFNCNYGAIDGFSFLLYPISILEFSTSTNSVDGPKDFVEESFLFVDGNVGKYHPSNSNFRNIIPKVVV